MGHVISLFDVVDCNDNKKENQLKCFKSELKSVNFLSVPELFQVFDTIKAITFSYDIDFMESILQYFKYGEIILGADFLVQKDNKLNTLLKEVLTNSYQTTNILRSHEKLVSMIQSGDVNFRTPAFVLDHRKIYLLKSDTGKTRVITASANMSKKAWNGDHMEFFEYDDTAFCYDEYEKDFETAWLNSQEIPYNVVAVKKDTDIINGNPIIKKVLKTKTAVVLQQVAKPISVNNIEYVINHEKLNEQYGQLLSGVVIKSKKGLVEIVPETVEKIKCNFAKIQQQAQVNSVQKEYPELIIDYDNKEIKLNDNVLDLFPTEKEIKNDIESLIDIFGEFDKFLGDTNKLKNAHFKLLNAIFVSPFNAKFRCVCKIQDIDTSSLPIFLLVASETANCGKTFMISVALKMMTGRKITPSNNTDLNKTKICNLQMVYKGIPVFIDEMDASSFARIKDLIKNPERCEDNQIENMPMLIFASNNILEPDETLRKRMVFLKIDARLPSNIDQSAYKSLGRSRIRNLGTGFYREYLRRMIEKLSPLLEKIILKENIPDDYYPDLMQISSNVILSIFTDYGYDIPLPFTTLTWNGDYSVNSPSVSEDAFAKIEEFYQNNKNLFSIQKDSVIIELGNSTDNKKMTDSWKNTLPSELNAKILNLKNSIRITLNRQELEKRLNIRFGKITLFGRSFL